MALLSRTTASFDAIKPVPDLVKLDNEFNQLVGANGALNGGSTGNRILTQYNHATEPVYEMNQLGAGPIAVLKQNTNTKLTFANSGQIVSSVAGGTAPITATSTTVCTNLNADLVDGIEGAAFAQLATARTKFSASWFIADPTIFPLNSFSLCQKAYVPSGIAKRVAILFSSGTASGSFTVEVRMHPTNDQTSQTLLASCAVNPGTVGNASFFSVANVDISDKYIYFILTARSSPAQLDINIALHGDQFFSTS